MEPPVRSPAARVDQWCMSWWITPTTFAAVHKQTASVLISAYFIDDPFGEKVLSSENYAFREQCPHVSARQSA